MGWVWCTEVHGCVISATYSRSSVWPHVTEMLGTFAADFGKMWGPDTQTRIKQTRVLIIDEVRSLPPHTHTNSWRHLHVVCGQISMVSGEFFTEVGQMVSTICHYANAQDARAKKERIPAFKGIQVVVCGDFAQLKPIPDNAHKRLRMSPRKDGRGNYRRPFVNRGTFAFESQGWADCRFTTVYLTQVMRQVHCSASVLPRATCVCPSHSLSLVYDW